MPLAGGVLRAGGGAAPPEDSGSLYRSARLRFSTGPDAQREVGVTDAAFCVDA